MADHLTYVSDTLPERSKAKQILYEIWYHILYLFFFIAGFIYKLKDHTEGEKRPVVLMSGLLGKTPAWFRVRKALIEKGHPVYSVSFGAQAGNIVTKSRKLEQLLVDKDIQDCYIVAHSMGGLISLGLGYKGLDRVRKIFTFGTPYKGSYLTFAMPFLPATIQMMPFSKFIKDSMARAQTFVNLQSVYAESDELIIPIESARLDRFNDVKLPEFGHFNMIMGPLGIECILELVKQEEDRDPLIRVPGSPEPDKAKETSRGKK